MDMAYRHLVGNTTIDQLEIRDIKRKTYGIVFFVEHKGSNLAVTFASMTTNSTLTAGTRR